MTLYTTIRDNPYYDGLSRLLSADYEEQYQFPGSPHNAGQFDVDLSYDLNGNIETLERSARGSATNSPTNPWETAYTSFTLDNLTYDYTGGGNQLQKVSDAATSNQTAAYSQFLDGNKSGDDYDYDANGNLTQDLNKGISFISYNHLNKPTVITYSNGNIIRYYYNAVGMKLRQTVYSADQSDPPQFAIRKRSDYLGAIHYEDADGDGTAEELEILFAQHEEGRYRPNSSEMIYEYTLTDHLGNTRITFGDSDADGDADILQENHYYPFGMAMTMSSTSSAAPPNDYLYNGKELQTELGLDWYDYGARMYDPSIGRWNGNDPLIELYPSITGYRYGFNNPLVFTDPTGMTEDYYLDASGVLYYDDNVKSQDDLNEGEEYVGEEVVFNLNGNQYYGDENGNVSYFLNLDEQIIYGYGNPNPKSSRRNNGTFLATDLYHEVSYMSHGLDNYADIVEIGVNIWGVPGGSAPYAFSRSAVSGGAKILSRYGDDILRWGAKYFSRARAATAARGSSRAFWSGAGSEASALSKGYQTLGQTRAGQNLAKLTADMPYYPGSQAYNMWARLSTAYAKGAKGTVHVFQNAQQGVGMQSIWRLYEYPALKANPNVTKIIFHY